MNREEQREAIRRANLLVGEVQKLVGEIQELSEYKSKSISDTLQCDWKELGEYLNIKIGASVDHNIMAYVYQLQQENFKLRDALDQLQRRGRYQISIDDCSVYPMSGIFIERSRPRPMTEVVLHVPGK